MKSKTNLDSQVDELVRWVDDAEVEAEMGSAFASVMQNPAVVWTKFILTDDRPNANKQRVPKTEFASLIKSGIFMPIKMAYKEILDGHEDSFPLGVITHLKEVGSEDETGISKIEALAALWSKERPEDINMLKERHSKGLPINISWEIQYTDSVMEDDGVQALVGTELSAATIVGMPAYAGRTPIVAFAAKKWSQPYIESLPDSSFLYVEPDKPKNSSGKTVQQFRHFPVLDAEGHVDITRLYAVEDEIGGSTLADSVVADVRSKVKELISMHKSGASLNDIESRLGVKPKVKEIKPTMDEKEFNELKAKADMLDAKVKELELKLSTTESALAEKESALAAKDTAIAELQAFKDGIEGEKAKAERLAAIREKFASAKIEKPDEYFTENAEKFLGMDDSDIDFMIQELVAFASKNSEASDKNGIPNLTGENGVDTKSLIEALREHKKK